MVVRGKQVCLLWRHEQNGKSIQERRGLFLLVRQKIECRFEKNLSSNLRMQKGV
jgi:hypothetical protein